jgi:hypothetical protein
MLLLLLPLLCAFFFLGCTSTELLAAEQITCHCAESISISISAGTSFGHGHLGCYHLRRL